MSKEKKIVRANFREACFARDKNRCRVCGKESPDLDAHHITNRNKMPNGGYVAENGVSLCPECHEKAEAAQPYDLRYGSVSLYDLIGFSEGAARLASEKLLT